MINSISSSSNSFISNTINNSSDDNLSFEQQLTLESILSNYDSNDLSVQDASEIVSAFQDAGIQPSKSLSNSMDSLGFDAQMVAELAGVLAPQMNGNTPPPPPSKGDEGEIADILAELLESENDDNKKNNSSTNSYLNNNDNSFESLLDYTSRILSLNDNAKEKVMDLFENYKPENTQLSSSEVSNVVKNSLKDILGDENNYKNTSFYA